MCCVGNKSQVTSVPPRQAGRVASSTVFTRLRGAPGWSCPPYLTSPGCFVISILGSVTVSQCHSVTGPHHHLTVSLVIKKNYPTLLSVHSIFCLYLYLLLALYLKSNTRQNYMTCRNNHSPLITTVLVDVDVTLGGMLHGLCFLYLIITCIKHIKYIL